MEVDIYVQGHKVIGRVVNWKGYVGSHAIIIILFI